MTKEYTEHQKKIIRLMNNKLCRLKRQLDKAIKNHFNTVYKIEQDVHDTKEKIRIYKYKIKINLEDNLKQK